MQERKSCTKTFSVLRKSQIRVIEFQIRVIEDEKANSDLQHAQYSVSGEIINLEISGIRDNFNRLYRCELRKLHSIKTRLSVFKLSRHDAFVQGWINMKRQMQTVNEYSCK